MKLKSKYYQSTLMICSGLLLLKAVYRIFQKHKLRNKHNVIREQKRIQIAQKIHNFTFLHQNEFGTLSQIRDKILMANVSELRQLISQKIVTITQVLLTFIEQSIKVNNVLNALSEILFEEAYALAKLQEQQFLTDPSILQRQPLFGIPISLKDFIAVKGCDSTFGQTIRCFQPDEQDSYQVKVIKLAGGIIFCKTNTPQMGKSIETQNFILGTTNNPYNLQRSPGGSSGGECALIAAAGSVMGIGSDLGGSLRIPASFCGLPTIKPSTVRWHKYEKYRIPVKQMGWNQIPTTAGPLARCVDDLVVMMQVQLDQSYYDQIPISQKDILYRPLAFDMKKYEEKRKLTIGIIESLEMWPAVEANQRAVRIVSEQLSEQGHSVIPITLPPNLISECVDTFYQIVGGLDEKGEIFKEMLDCEDHIPAYNLLLFSYNLPSWFKRFLVNFYKLIGKSREAIMLSTFSHSFKGTDVLQKLGEMQILQQKFNAIWQEAGIDALIMPTCAMVAFKHGQTSLSQLMAVYSNIFNLFNYTAGCVPVDYVKETEQNYPYSRDKLDKLTKECMKNSIGLPVGVQIITKPFEDELCLNIMKKLEESLKFKRILAI